VGNSIQIHTLVLGFLQTNCYILADQASREGIVIDPAAEGARLVQWIRSHHLKVGQVLLTHGHYDHIGGVGFLKNELGVKLWIHEKDAEMLGNPDINLSSLLENEGVSYRADGFLEEGQSFKLGTGQIDVVHTPGHTPGSVSFASDHFVIAGDTLFRNSVGRTDFPYGSASQLIETIRTKLFTFDDDVVVYPGHGPKTTIGREKRENPFVAQNQPYI
jgi:glyoxylase-like metal-dependent hydrolase (beta-lactamase superfamily II)